MIKKDFKQKYFLYCKDCKVEKIIPVKLAQVDRKDYIRRVKIQEL